MSLYLGNTSIGEIYIGNTKISEAYLGSQLVYSSGPPSKYLKFKVNSVPQVGTVRITNNLGYNIKYSESLEGTQIILASGSTTPTNLTEVYLFGLTQNYNGSNPGLTITGNNIAVSGSIGNAQLMNLFLNQTALTDASGLKCGDVPNLNKDYQYASMFQGCTNLITPPQIPYTAGLPANAFRSMFEDCTSLTTAPVLLVASPGINGYMNMFKNCISLTTPPALNCTLLSTQCYYGMFWGCTGLRSLPVLRANNFLAKYCYAYMFRYCTQFNFTTDTSKTAYRLPYSGTGVEVEGWANCMFAECPGANTSNGFADDIGTPEINTTYYYTVNS